MTEDHRTQNLDGVDRIRSLLRASRVSRFGCDALPALPSSITRLRYLLSAPVIGLRELTRVVWSDPGIAAKVLYRAMLENSGGCPSRLESVLLVGVRALTEIALSTPTVSVVDPCAERLNALIRHCRVVSLLSERCALLRGGCSADRAAIVGLLHHVGEIASSYCGSEHSPLQDCFPVKATGREWLIDELDCIHVGEGSSDSQLLQVVAIADRIANSSGLRMESERVDCGSFQRGQLLFSAVSC